MKKRILQTAMMVLMLLFGSSGFAQSISGKVNTYWGVSNIAANVVTIEANSSGAIHSLVAGDLVLVIQMNGASVDADGGLGINSNLNNAGHYEFARVQSVAPSGQGQNVTLTGNLTNTFTTTDAAVQLIWVPDYNIATVTGDVFPEPWNGEKGGVVVLNACELIMNANIHADASGFRGGENTLDILPSQCNVTTMNGRGNPNEGAKKGEGIGFLSGFEYSAGTCRGSSGTGGGGGNAFNAGGAGGANFGTGGHGGDKLIWKTGGVFNSCHDGVLLVTGGVGGVTTVPINYSIVNGNTTVFMGGGGGAGHADQYPQPGISVGGNGGGIVIIHANTITGNASVRISANGHSFQGAGTIREHGGGGGGAGGSVLLDVQDFAQYAGSIQAKGGDGASLTEMGNPTITDYTIHGPGGGGGGGVIRTSNAVLLITPETDAGGNGTTTDETGTQTAHAATSGGAGQLFSSLLLGLNNPNCCPERTIQMFAPPTICQGQEGLIWAVVTPFSPQLTYTWNTGGSNNGALTITTGGTYSVTVTDQEGCETSASVAVAETNIDVTVIDQFGHSIFMGTNCAPAPIIQLTTTADGGTEPYTYSWGNTPPPGLSHPFTTPNPFLNEAVAINGYYTVTVTDANGCSATASYNNRVMPCCVNYYDPPYAQIDQMWINQQILLNSGFVTFPAKCFVLEMLEIPLGTFVNINNSEVVFKDQFGGITFKDYSQIDAQNSEFKPCDPGNWWVGLIFIGQQTGPANKGVIHECVFTNARSGISALNSIIEEEGVNGSLVHLDIVNNEFFNCLNGVDLQFCDFSGSIAGNAFHVSTRLPDYGLQTDPFPSGITSFQSNLSRAVTDNRFTNDEPDQGWPCTGVVCIESSMVINNNEFSNMYRCLDVSQNHDPVSFENNNIQYNSDYLLSDDGIPGFATHAIRINLNQAFVIIKGNEINGNFPILHEGSPDLIAIYTEHVSGVLLVENEISGFRDAIQIINPGMAAPNGDLPGHFIGFNTISDFTRNGIACVGTPGTIGQDVTMYANEINSTRMLSEGAFGNLKTGILLDNVTQYAIVYNSINMEGIEKDMTDYPNTLSTSSTSIGINCRTYGDQSNSVIVENCIHETGRAINFEEITGCSIELSPGVFAMSPCSIPIILNNYMYNYCEAGMAFNGRYVGDIGFANAPSGSGRNMFVSNYLTPNYGGAVDVISPDFGSGIVMAGNSSNLVVTDETTVDLSPGNTITSTASCGNYVGNDETELGGRKINPNQFNLVFQADYEKAYPIELEGSDYLLRADYQTEISKVGSTERLRYLTILYNILDNNETVYTEADKLVQLGNTADFLGAHDRFMFNYNVAIQKNEFQEAETMLNGFVPATADDADFIAMEAIKLSMYKGEIEAFNLSEDDQITLVAIDNRRGKYAAEARDILNMTTKAHDYIFAAIPNGKYHYEFHGAGLRHESFIDIYPNPADNKVNVRYFLDESVNSAELSIINVLGEKLIAQPLYALSTEVQIPVSSLPAGVYMVNVTNNGNTVKTGKLVIE